jgi:2-keto-4-pentenoate hydratase/2-oxohepta-3-ene-1,7-dioic acid hydratase in catechol pathway
VKLLRASYVEQTEALDHVAGYCVVNDVSERDYQIERGGTWGIEGLGEQRQEVIAWQRTAGGPSNGL